MISLKKNPEQTRENDLIDTVLDAAIQVLAEEGATLKNWLRHGMEQTSAKAMLKAEHAVRKRENFELKGVST